MDKVTSYFSFKRHYFCWCGAEWHIEKRLRIELDDDKQVVVDERGATREYPKDSAICLPHGIQAECPNCRALIPPRLCPDCYRPVEVMERDEIRSSLDDWLYEEAEIFIRCPKGHERKVAERIDGER